MTENERPFRVLSLDGGGMRGIYMAAFLDRLAFLFSRQRGVGPLDIGKGFDLIVGTSTGAIVGCAAATGKPMDEVVQLYRKHGRKIFPHRIKGLLSIAYRVTQGGRFVRKGDAALRSALTDVLGEETMEAVFVRRGIGLIVPAVAMNNHRSWVFKKTGASGPRDDNYKLVDVCMATSAAPVFRSLAAIDDPNGKDVPKQVFADGGLWANNPVLVGLIDAISCAPKGASIEIFSLGTCARPEGEFIKDKKVHRSLLGWFMGAKIGPLSISAQEFAFDNMARFLANKFSELGVPIRMIRFPKQDVPGAMLDYLALDDARDESMARLVQQANSDANMVKSACDDPRNADGKMIHNLMMSLPELPAQAQKDEGEQP